VYASLLTVKGGAFCGIDGAMVMLGVFYRSLQPALLLHYCMIVHVFAKRGVFLMWLNFQKLAGQCHHKKSMEFSF
jgi:hypothetical protein